MQTGQTCTIVKLSSLNIEGKLASLLMTIYSLQDILEIVDEISLFEECIEDIGGGVSVDLDVIIILHIGAN